MFRSFIITGFRCITPFVISSVLIPVALADQPRVPTDDAEVLERLPKLLTLNRDRMATIRDQLAADPENAELASVAARAYIKMGKTESDPRFYGYARSAIARWWDDASPPVNIALIRAKLKEHAHDYAGALEDAKEVLRREKDNRQAWIEVANLNRVLGRFDHAWGACNKLKELSGEEDADQTAWVVSVIPLMAANGQANEAYQMLREHMASVAEDSSDQTEILNWGLTLQASIAQSLGWDETAEEHFQVALKLNPDDFYLKRNYGEFLLEQGRNDEIIALLSDDLNDNGVLLLVALAGHRADHPLAEQWKSLLADRFREIRQRESLPHGRFESRFELELNDDPQRALELALENWQQQKEFRDTANVLEAARAAGDAKAALPVIDFIRETKLEDVRIHQLAMQLVNVPAANPELE